MALEQSALLALTEALRRADATDLMRTLLQVMLQVATTAGDLTVKIPKVRAGSFFPSLLAPRRRIDVALHAVVMQAFVEGMSTRKVDDLVPRDLDQVALNVRSDSGC